MANFKFRILDDKAAYQAIEQKDSMTFYLTKTGEGWFGENPLFGGDSQSFSLITESGELTPELGKVYVFAVDGITIGEVSYPQGIYYSADGFGVTNLTYGTIAKYIIERAVKAASVAAGYVGDEETIMTSAAIVKYVTDMVSTQAIMETAFFSNVISYELTQEDVDDATNNTTSGPAHTDYPGITGITADCHAGDHGLIFIMGDRTPDDEADDAYVFINLHKLINIYEVTSKDGSAIITPETNPSTHKTTFDVSVAKAESDISESIKSGADNLAEGNSYDTSSLADNKFVTEKYLAEIMAKVLKGYVPYTTE